MMRVEPQYNEGQRDWQNLFASTRFCYTMEPRYSNEPLYNAVLGMKNDFLYPSNSKIIMKKNPRCNKTLRYGEFPLYRGSFFSNIVPLITITGGKENSSL